MSANKNPIQVTLKIWRQRGPKDKGGFEVHRMSITPDSSFLELLDALNERLTGAGQEPVAFDHDCREGICGTCSLVINGQPHGPDQETTACQLHMRSFKDGETLTVEPFRARSFPVIKDLVVDRSAFDRIQQAGGYVSINTGSAPDAHAIPIPRGDAERAFDAAACIGCGACVAACPNASAMLFVGAKISQLRLLPQGLPERKQRALRMVVAMDREGFGNCTNHFECESACPKGISITNIARMNREFLGASFLPG